MRQVGPGREHELGQASFAASSAGAFDMLAWLVARFPYAWLRGFGALLGFVAGTLLRIRRDHVEASLGRAGLDARAASGMYRSLGAGVFELLWLAGRGPTPLTALASIDPASRRMLEEARSGGRGIVLAATHTGNWDLAACAVASIVPLTVVTKRLRARSLDAFWHRTRARFGVRLVTAEAALSGGRRELASGGAVAMMIDQAPMRRRHGVVGSFLGADAWLDRSPAVLAARTGSPLVVAASWRKPNGHHALSVLLMIEPPSDAGAQRSWIEEATKQSAAALEHFVRAHPESWLWLHRRWKTPSRS